MDPELASEEAVSFLTRRELAVLAVATAVVAGALLLLVVASSQVSALLGPG
jgi:hypothetical protein